MLLIDNCSAHPQELKTRDGSVTCTFLPANTTSLIQPMDQGVLQAMKNRYKRKLLQKVICDQDLDPTQNIKEIVKQHTVKDALYMLADAWEEGHADSIFKVYGKLQIHPVRPSVSEPEPENISTEPIMDVLNQVANREGLSSSDVEDWLNVENELPTSPQLSDEQILESVVGQSSFEDESSNEEEEEEGQDEKIVSNSEAVECFKKCLSWMERQSNVDAIQIMQLRRMMELSVRT